MEQPRPVALSEAKVDGELERASKADLAGMDCGFRRLAVVLELDSRAGHDSSADRAACDGRKDIAGILVDTAACGHKMELEVGLAGSQDTNHVAVNEIQ